MKELKYDNESIFLKPKVVLMKIVKVVNGLDPFFILYVQDVSKILSIGLNKL